MALKSLALLIQRYEETIVNDPSIASKIESMLKVLSYIIPGRFGGGYLLSEFAYCISNLYSLLNDYIIAKHCPSSSLINKLPLSQRRLLWLLALIENTEVIVEVCGESLYREVGKWLIVLIMRFLKLIVQSVVIFRYRSRILTSPAVPAVTRKKGQQTQDQLTTPPDGQPLAYTGTRTGKVIRSIHGDPGIPYSELSRLVNRDGRSVVNKDGVYMSDLTSQQLVAEALHIGRPLVHIFSMIVFQQTSWKPWLISLAMDIISLHLHRGLVTFKSSEPSEMLRRRLVLLLYLLRTPFYDQYVKNLLFAFLKYIADHVPLTSWITVPLIEYIPLWQGIYSYNWMS